MPKDLDKCRTTFVWPIVVALKRRFIFNLTFIFNKTSKKPQRKKFTTKVSGFNFTWLVTANRGCWHEAGIRLGAQLGSRRRRLVSSLWILRSSCHGNNIVHLIHGFVVGCNETTWKATNLVAVVQTNAPNIWIFRLRSTQTASSLHRSLSLINDWTAWKKLRMLTSESIQKSVCVCVSNYLGHCHWLATCWGRFENRGHDVISIQVSHSLFG